MSHILSKSTYLKGVKCKKALYLNKFHKNLRDEISESQMAIFSQGANVGELAQELFPGGLDFTPETFYDFSKSIMQTSNAIAEGTPVIYEAAFQFDGVLCALDILVKNGEYWNAYEVKSTTSVKDTHITDASVQYHVMRNCGIHLSDVSIVVIDNTYQKEDVLDVQKLFKVESVFDRVIALQPEVKENIVEFKNVLSSSHIPKVLIGEKCSNPYNCEFIGHCWKNVPEYSVFNIARINKNEAAELYHSGISTISEIPEENNLKPSQVHQVQCEKDKSVIINKKGLKSFKEQLKYPLHFLDFETAQMAVPEFEKQNPYQQVPFQYSIHIKLGEKSNVLHLEFLADSINEDPRLKFIKNLILNCGNMGSLLVYNLSFERRILQELIWDFPEYEYQLKALIDRMVDLMKPFQMKYYYTPAMKGKYTIKYVLPALCPELSYNDLEIKEGGNASRVFTEMLTGKFSGDIKSTRTALLEYCKLDTWAMVKLLEKIDEVI